MLTALTLLFSLPAFAVPEAELSAALFAPSAYSRAALTGVGGLPLSYIRFGTPLPRGCLVIVPGQSEPALKYAEVAYDLTAAGFGPIYSLDHRGQGFSGRMLEDPQKNTVRKFDDYVTDFATFVDQAVLQDKNCAHPALLAHSMGGAITAAYLEKMGNASPFRKVAMSSPMLKILFPAPRTEHGVIIETFFACNSPFGPSCDDYAQCGPLNLDEPFAPNLLTHSASRFSLKIEMFRRYPEIKVGSPTVRWVRQAALADRELRRPRNVQRIASQVLLLEAGNDHLVDIEAENEFCAALGSRCEKVLYPGAYHEILMETDSVRNHALARATAFFSESRSDAAPY